MSLSFDGRAELFNYLKEQPAIDAIYQFKRKLHRLMMKKCKRLIPLFLNMIGALKASSFKRLITLGKTFNQWKEEVVRVWRFTKNN